MAIERAEELSETEEMPSEMELEGEELPGSLLGGMEVSPGDVVRIKVVAAPDEDGMWRGVYASDKGRTSAIDESASVYKSPREMET